MVHSIVKDRNEKVIFISLRRCAIYVGSVQRLANRRRCRQNRFYLFKMASKIRVPESGAPATFKDAKFSFAKTSGGVSEILQDASVEFDLSSIDTGKNVVRDNNVKSKFFALLTTQKVSGKIVSVTGDDTSGTANASINFNGASKEVALKYEIKGDKLVAMGQIDLQSDFDVKEAFDKFAADKVIQGLHGKKT